MTQASQTVDVRPAASLVVALLIGAVIGAAVFEFGFSPAKIAAARAEGVRQGQTVAAATLAKARTEAWVELAQILRIRPVETADSRWEDAEHQFRSHGMVGGYETAITFMTERRHSVAPVQIPDGAKALLAGKGWKFTDFPANKPGEVYTICEASVPQLVKPALKVASAATRR
jgi:hypothetical protein